MTSSMYSNVCKIFVVRAPSNYSLPWQVAPQKRASGSGFVFSTLSTGRVIVTNAHVIEEATNILVRIHGHPKKFEATVLCEAHQCDLALLQVEDGEFWRQVNENIPSQLGVLPDLGDNVRCVGFPTGGDQLSTTSGVVSRIEVKGYAGRHTALLVIQIDAAINSGNSGGPVIGTNDGKIIGVAFSHLSKAQNVGYVIPSCILEHFLRLYEMQKSLNETIRSKIKVQFCDIGLDFQKAENKSLRNMLMLPDDLTGVLVTDTETVSPFVGVVFPKDVLLEFDGVKIADDGTIPLRDGSFERVDFTHLSDLKMPGDPIKLVVWRAGQRVDLQAIAAPVPTLVPKLNGFDAAPEYLIVGGLVFQPLSVPLLIGLYGKDWRQKAPVRLVDVYATGKMKSPDENVIILSQILSSSITVGYTCSFRSEILYSFNDTTPITSLAQLRDAVEQCGDKFLEFKIGEFGEMIVLDRLQCLEEEPSILKTYSISNKYSQNLQKKE